MAKKQKKPKTNSKPNSGAQLTKNKSNAKQSIKPHPKSNPNEKRILNFKQKKKKKETNAKVTFQIIEDITMHSIELNNLITNANVQSSDNQPIEIEEENFETLIEKNGAIVDKYTPEYLNYHVVLDTNGLFNSKAFACTLNYSNIKHNNNKFYIIQLIQEDKSEKYYIFLRWGRVGRKGQTNMIKMTSLDDAIVFFLTKYEGKKTYGYEEVNFDFSSNRFDGQGKDNRDDHFQNQLSLNQCDIDIETETQAKISPQVIDLIRLIYDINIMNDQMKEIGFDASKLPLGKISKETIIDGYCILQRIEQVITKEAKGDLSALSSKFYTKIPHNFGFLHLSSFTINTIDLLKEKIGLLESLKDIQIATKIIDEGIDKSKANANSKESLESIEESYYNQLNCTIKPFDINSVPLLTQYLNASSSLNTNLTLVLLEAFELHKDVKDNFGNSIAFNDSIGNVKLLWYGTRITNYISLIKKGFKMAPPEAPSANFPFGKGIYFSDMSIKASSSCYPLNDIGLLLLCEVALGDCHEMTKTDSTLPINLPEGKNSVKGCGMNVPQSEVVDDNGVIIPLGKAIKRSDIKVSELYF